MGKEPNVKDDGPLASVSFRKSIRRSDTSESQEKRGTMKCGQGECQAKKPDHLQSDREYGPIFLVALPMPNPGSHLGKKDKKWDENDGFPAIHKKG